MLNGPMIEPTVFAAISSLIAVLSSWQSTPAVTVNCPPVNVTLHCPGSESPPRTSWCWWKSLLVIGWLAGLVSGIAVRELTAFLWRRVQQQEAEAGTADPRQRARQQLAALKGGKGV